MTSQTKSRLVVWTQYFLIALIAEWGAGMALFPHEPGNDINLQGYVQKKVLPHLFWWFLIFMFLSAAKLTIGLIARSGEDDSKSESST